MAYCRKCGEPVDDEAVICPKCGVQLKKLATGGGDSGSFGWAVLGFFIPVAGLILWLVWMNDKPKNAKMAGIGALVNVLISVVFYIIVVVAAVSFNV